MFPTGLRALLIALLVGLAAGCGAVAVAAETSSSLREAGYPDAAVQLNTTNGVDTVQVTTGPHPTLTGEDAFDGVAAIVWNELPRRFDQLDLTVGSESAGISHEGLEQRFGPRDPALDEATIGGDVTGALGVVAAVLLGGLVLLVLIVILIVRAVRKRRPRVPPGMPGAPGPAGYPPHHGYPGPGGPPPGAGRGPAGGRAPGGPPPPGRYPPPGGHPPPGSVPPPGGQPPGGWNPPGRGRPPQGRR